MKWQKIETAPRDGRSILIYQALNPKTHRILAARWDDGAYTKAPGWRADVHSFVKFDPTHWQPLPEPPEA